jgi:hypothetical protein
VSKQARVAHPVVAAANRQTDRQPHILTNLPQNTP